MKGETLPAEDPTKLVMTVRQPRGVYAVITPWNYPVNIPVEYWDLEVATGNTIVWVPTPTTSMAAVELMRATAGAGLPAGVLNLVIGEGPVVGDEIVYNPDTAGIGFTGSAATGRRIAERGAGKPMLLELGGNGPLLVFEDADLKRAAAAAASGAFSNAGQICAATGRVLAHESVADELAERIAGHARNYILGDPLHQGVTMGPLNNPKVAAKVREHVDDAVAAGANVVTAASLALTSAASSFSTPTGTDWCDAGDAHQPRGDVRASHAHPFLSRRRGGDRSRSTANMAFPSECSRVTWTAPCVSPRPFRRPSAISTTRPPTGRSTCRSEAVGHAQRRRPARRPPTLEAMTEIKMITVTRAI